MNHFTEFSTSFFLLLLLGLPIPSVLSSTECPADVSHSIKDTLDNAPLFSTCSKADKGVQVDVDSLLDVLDLSERDFLIFCRSSDCIKPVKTLLQSIPTDCLISYHGAARNLSKEVWTLYRECAEVVDAADKTDDDYIYRYFLD